MKVESLAELAHKHIHEWIVTQELVEGQQLKEEELASRLGISRPPVREAFKMLEAEGLVERRPRRGVFVTRVTQKDVWEIYTLKAVLYEMAAEVAVQVMSNEQIARLERKTEQMAAMVNKTPPDILGYQELHQKFHRLILNAADNQRLNRFATTLHNQVRRFSYKTLQDAEHLQASLQYHQRIVEAFYRKDGDAARRLMRTHVLEVIKVVNGSSKPGQPAAGTIPSWEDPAADEAGEPDRTTEPTAVA